MNIDDRLKEIYEKWKTSSKYDIDGLVCSGINYIPEVKEFLPKKKISYKINSEGIPTKVIGIEWEVSKQGKLKPVLLIKPTEISGSTISRCTANNAQWMVDRGLGIGSEILIVKSGEIIPKVINVVTTVEVSLLENCPNCGSNIHWNGVDLQCMNDECSEIKRVEHFIKAIEIERVSEQTLENWGINTFEDLFVYFSADTKYKSQIDFENALIEKVYHNTPENILKSFPMSGFGTTLFDKLYKFCGSDLATMKLLIENVCGGGHELYSLPTGIGERTIQKMKSDWDIAWGWMNRIIADPRYKTPEIKQQKERGNKLSGTFLITGTLSQGRKYFEQLIIDNGGTVASSVSKNLNYLIVGADAGSKLDKAKKLDIKIISESDLMEMINE